MSHITRSLSMLPCLLFLISSTSAYEPEKETFYHDKLLDSTFTLTPSTDEIIVVFEDDVDLGQFENNHNLKMSQDFEKKVMAAPYRIPSGAKLDNVLEIVNSDTMVKRALPVYTDQEGFTKYCVPTELTVRFVEGIGQSRMLEIISSVGSSVERKQRTPGYFTIRAPDNKGYFETIRELNSFKEVEFSEPSAISYNCFDFTPNDYYFALQWAHNNTGQIDICDGCPPYSDHDIDAITGWDVERGTPDVVLSIIDTGMDMGHLDLLPNLLDRNNEDWDFYDDSDTEEGRSPDDFHGHGTACAGVAAAASDNNIGVSGVAHYCKIMPLQIAHGETIINQDAADAIDYAWRRRPEFGGLILSCSWSIYTGNFDAIRQAIEYAVANDVLVCVASGNANSQSIPFPAQLPETMAIGATSPCDERKASYWGSCDDEWWWGSNYGPDLDVAAPGVYIYTTDIRGDGGFNPRYGGPAENPDYIESFGGTSGACPLAAGIGALLWSRDPSLSAEEIRGIINETADQVGGYVYDPETGKSLELGHGRVNLVEALCGKTLCGTVHDGNRRPFTLDCSPYVVGCDVVVPENQILTLPAGINLVFEEGTRIIALGTFQSEASTGNPSYLLSSDFETIRVKMNGDFRLEQGGELKIY